MDPDPDLPAAPGVVDAAAAAVPAAALPELPAEATTADPTEDSATAELRQIVQTSAGAASALVLHITALQLLATAHDMLTAALHRAVPSRTATELEPLLAAAGQVARNQASRQFQVAQLEQQALPQASRWLKTYRQGMESFYQTQAKAMPIPLGLSLQRADDTEFTRERACVLAGPPALVAYLLEHAFAVCLRPLVVGVPDFFNVLYLGGEQPTFELQKYPAGKFAPQKVWQQMDRDAKFRRLFAAVQRAPYHMPRVDLLLVSDLRQLSATAPLQAFQRLRKFCRAQQTALIAGYPTSELTLIGAASALPELQSAEYDLRSIQYTPDPEFPGELSVSLSPFLPTFNVPSDVLH